MLLSSSCKIAVPDHPVNLSVRQDYTLNCTAAGERREAQNDAIAHPPFGGVEMSAGRENTCATGGNALLSLSPRQQEK